MIRGPILEIQPDGTRLELTSPDPRTVPFGAAGTQVWGFNNLGQHVSSITLNSPAYLAFPWDYKMYAPGKLNLKHVEIPW